METTLLEEYKLEGKTEGSVLDKDTNEPIATYKKDSYGKHYSVGWHPTFLALHPDIRHSMEARDIKVLRPEGRDSVLNQVGYLHASLAKNGFKDRIPAVGVDSPRLDEGKGILYSHPETGEPILSIFQQKEYPATVRSELHPDFVAKHNISEPVKQSIETKINRQNSHRAINSEITNMLSEVTKKKVAVGLHTLGNAVVKVFHTDSSPTEASAAHENYLKNDDPSMKDINITRLSPTHFVGHTKDYMIHSIVNGNQIHQVTTNTNNYGSAKTPLNQNF